MTTQELDHAADLESAGSPAGVAALDEILTEEEAAALVHEGVRGFMVRRQRGTGPAFIRVGRRALYRRSVVLDWLISLERPSGTN